MNAIAEFGAGVMEKRDTCCFLYHFIQRVIFVTHSLLSIKARTPAAQSRCMGKELRHRDITHALTRLGNIGALGIHQNSLRRKFRQVFLDRLIHFKLALFIELQHSNASDLPGHGIDAKQRAFTHRSNLFDIRQAQRFVVNNLAVSGNRRYHSGNITVVNVLLQVGSYRLQTDRRKADTFGRSDFQKLGITAASCHCQRDAQCFN